jgi:sugar lactone lactonase YvrE
MAWLPLMVVAIVVGVSWNLRKWLIAAAVFHAIFAFFFTTVFTNIAGLGTGMIYSLGYWLEQQGVRRGSQPQYYYLILVMPFYEFLPVIGSFLAMIAGYIFFWRWRETQYEIDAATALSSEAMADRSESQPTDEAEPGVAMSISVEGDTPIEAEAVPVDSFLWQYRQRRLEELPFLMFMAWLAVLNLIMYSLAGEKMPWLAIHLTYPMIFLTAWFFGRIFSRIDWKMVRENGWMMLVALPVVTITLIQVIGPSLIGRGPFQGLETQQLNQTYAWVAAFAASGVGVGFVLWLVERTSWRLLVQAIAFTSFMLLSLITFRSAWLAAFINYDMPTEFIVYAHAAPAIKWVLNDIEELSLRTTDGMDLKFAYDNSVSWPYSWYFRDFRNAVFVGENPTVQNLDGAVVVVVGDDKRSKVEPILEDQYIRFDHMRLWWPMQDYFNLTADRINNALDFTATNTQAAQIREGMFDIWWNRDYTTYGRAVEKDFSVTNWPVSDIMHVYIRRDVAKQVWEYGTGDGSVFSDEPEPVNLCRTNWLPDKAAVSVMQAAPQPMNRPLGITVDANGNVYVAEEFGHRISIFDANGQYTGSIGQEGAEAGAFLNRPNDVYAAPDGSLFVADTWNYRITHMTADGTVLQQWGQNYSVGFGAEATPTDGFWGPRDVALDSLGQVYVSDTGNKRIRVYALDGDTVTHRFDVGLGGSGPGELDEPNSVVVHPVDGRIFIVDTWNRRISVFNKEGGFLTSFPVRAWYNKDSGSLPYMALDATRDMLYVGDPEAGRVMVFNTAGECLGSFGSASGEAPTNAQFNVVSGLAVDNEGNVYVADAGLNRVLKFTPFEVPNPAAGLNMPPGVVVDEEGRVIMESDPNAPADGETTGEVTVEAESGEG